MGKSICICFYFIFYRKSIFSVYCSFTKFLGNINVLLKTYYIVELILNKNSSHSLFSKNIIICSNLFYEIFFYRRFLKRASTNVFHIQSNVFVLFNFSTRRFRSRSTRINTSLVLFKSFIPIFLFSKHICKTAIKRHICTFPYTYILKI